MNNKDTSELDLHYKRKITQESPQPHLEERKIQPLSFSANVCKFKGWTSVTLKSEEKIGKENSLSSPALLGTS